MRKCFYNTNISKIFKWKWSPFNRIQWRFPTLWRRRKNTIAAIWSFNADTPLRGTKQKMLFSSAHSEMLRRQCWVTLTELYWVIAAYLWASQQRRSACNYLITSGLTTHPCLLGIIDRVNKDWHSRRNEDWKGECEILQECAPWIRVRGKYVLVQFTR